MALAIFDKNTPYINLSENFSFAEVYSVSHPDPDGSIKIDLNVINIAQYIRDQLGIPVKVNSAYRNKEYNALVPGASTNSQHTQGRALDLHANGIIEFVENAHKTENVHFKAMQQMGLRGIGYYDWGVHIDTRIQDKISTWDYRLKKKVVTSSIGIFVYVALIYAIRNVMR